MIVIEGPVPFDDITMGQAEGDKQASKKIAEMAQKRCQVSKNPHFPTLKTDGG